MNRSKAVIETVGEDVVICTLAFLSAEDIAAFSATNKYMREISNTEIIWKHRLVEDLAVSSLDCTPPCSKLIGRAHSWRLLYLEWRHAFIGYPVNLVKRARLFWNRFEAWGNRNAPAIVDTLGPPLTESYIEMRTRGGPQLPSSLRLMYRFHNGQHIDMRSIANVGLGMFGGTDFYDHFISVMFMKIEQLVDSSVSLCKLFEGRAARLSANRDTVYSHMIGSRPSHEASSLVYMFGLGLSFAAPIKKGYFISANSAVYTNTEGFSDYIQCHPMTDTDSPMEQTGYLFLWLEEYLRRLEEGIYIFNPPHNANSIPKISHFPSKPLYNKLSPETNIGATSAVTRGVSVTGCPAFIPEFSNPFSDKLFWSYSIRMKLLADHPERPLGLTSCQLTHRHWIIYEPPSIEEQRFGQEGKTQEVHGEAVVGLYPLLKLDESEECPWSFSYQSCSSGSSYPCTFRGYMDFVPGNKDSPTGPSFPVTLAPMTLTVPDFIY